MTRFGIIIAVFASACSTAEDPSGRIAVHEPNELGAAALEITRTSDGDNKVFELRALATDDREVGSVRLTIGSIPDLAELAPAEDPSDAFGAEIVVAVGDAHMRVITRETSAFDVNGAVTPDPAIAHFLELRTVSETLVREAAINYETAPAASNAAYTTPTSCPPSYLNTSPVAEQCCDQPQSTNGYEWEVFFAGTTLVNKKRNPHGIICAASDGTSGCTGTSCFYGPNAFAKPSLYPGYTKPNVMATSGGYCVAWYNYNNQCTNGHCPPVTFPNVGGTFSTGQTCSSNPAVHAYVAGGTAWDY